MNVKTRFVDNVIILDLEGSLDRLSALQVRQAVIDVTKEQPVHVVVNLKGVDRMDSSGLSVLVLGLRRARENQGNFCLCSLQSPVRMIFELTRFDKVFEIFINEEDAVLAAASQYQSL
jgi:anti-sigma B factor antagonist